MALPVGVGVSMAGAAGRPAAGAQASGQLDRVLGRTDWLEADPRPTTEHALVRLEPLAVLRPPDHPLAEKGCGPGPHPAGTRDVGLPSHPRTPEWGDLVAQFLALSGAHSTPPHLPAIGPEEQGYHLVRQGVPILTSIDTIPVPGGVVRQLVEPVPLYAWSMAWRRGVDTPGVAALRTAAAALATAERWLAGATGDRAGTWLPEPDASRLANGDVRLVTERW